MEDHVNHRNGGVAATIKDLYMIASLNPIHLILDDLLFIVGQNIFARIEFRSRQLFKDVLIHPVVFGRELGIVRSVLCFLRCLLSVLVKLLPRKWTLLHIKLCTAQIFT